MGIKVPRELVREWERKGLVPPAPPRRKYRNTPTAADGITFASAKEARRYRELRALEAAGAVEALELQPAFDLAVNGVRVCRYVADFAYRVGGLRVVEDVKSPATRRNRAYRIKVKLMAAVLGIAVREV